MLPLGWDFKSGRQYIQTCPWISEEIHHLFVVDWPRWQRSCNVTSWLHIVNWNAWPKCRSCQWNLEEVHHTRLMPPLWGTLGRHKHRIASSLVYRFAWVRKTPRCSYGSMVSSYHSRLSGFYPRGMSTSIIWSTKGCRQVHCLVGRCCWRDLDHLECWLCVGGVIPLECSRAMSEWRAHRPGGVWHEPPTNRDQPLAFWTPLHGIAPSPQCGFGVVGEC